MTLETCLKRLPTETLEKIYEVRNIGYETNEPMPKQRAQLLAKILRDLKSGYNHSAILQEIDARMLRLLQFAVISEKQERVQWSDLVELAGGRAAEPTMREAFVRLVLCGLFFEEDNGDYFLQAELKRTIPVPLSERYGLEQCLTNETVARLQQMSRKIGVAPDGPKAKLVNRIMERILLSPPGSRTFEQLEGDEKRVFEALVERGGVASVTEFARKHDPGYSPHHFYYSAVRSYGRSREPSAIENLLDRALIFQVSYSYSFSQQLVIPRDILRIVHEQETLTFWTSPPPALKPLTDAVTMTQRNDFILSDCVLFLAALSRIDAVQTQSGLINKVALRSIAKLYFKEDDYYAGFLYALLLGAGLIIPYGERARFVVTEQGMEWLDRSAPLQWMQLMGAWLNNPYWIETREDPLSAASADLYNGRMGIDLRTTLLEVLPANLTEHFYDLHSLTETMLYHAPLLMTALGTQSDLENPHRYFERVIGETLLWMGCVEIASERPTTTSATVPTEPEPTPAKKTTKRTAKTVAEPPPHPVGFRFTPFGVELFKQDMKALEALTPEEEGFYLQPNGDLIVPPYLDAAVRYRLLLLADPVAKQSGTLQINRDSLRRAFDEGEMQNELLAFLQQHSRSGIPQPIEYLIREVGGKHGHIRIGAAKFYLTVDDPMLLKELQARKEFAPYLKNKIAETAIAIETDDPEKLMRDLRKAGYAPVYDDPARKQRKPPKAPSQPVGMMPDLEQIEQLLTIYQDDDDDEVDY